MTETWGQYMKRMEPYIKLGPEPPKPKRKTKLYWYKIYIEECVLCGHTEETRERIYGKKPKKGTHEFSQSACSGHFL